MHRKRIFCPELKKKKILLCAMLKHSMVNKDIPRKRKIAALWLNIHALLELEVNMLAGSYLLCYSYIS
jgi:hypothetical protein